MKKTNKCWHGIIVPKPQKDRKDVIKCPNCKKWHINPEILKNQMSVLNSFFQRLK